MFTTQSSLFFSYLPLFFGDLLLIKRQFLVDYY